MAPAPQQIPGSSPPHSLPAQKPDHFLERWSARGRGTGRPASSRQIGSVHESLHGGTGFRPNKRSQAQSTPGTGPLAGAGWPRGCCRRDHAMPRGLPPCPPNLCPFRLSATKGQRSGVTCHLHPSGGQPPSCHRPRPTDSSTLPLRVSRAPRRTAAGAGKDCGQVTPLPRGQTRGHLVPVTVHGQQTQQVEGMAALGEAAHGHWPNGLAVGHVAVARHHSQFLHTDDAVLEGDQHRARSLTARCATGWGGS